MARVMQSVLVLLAIVCALALSASSTVELAARVAVPGWAHPAAVGLLEVASVAGTWIWLTEPRLRAEAAAVVALASVVTGIGGVLAYGAFGVVAPLGLIVTVHLMARAWQTDRTTRTGPDQQQTTEQTTDRSEDDQQTEDDRTEDDGRTGDDQHRTGEDDRTTDQTADLTAEAEVALIERLAVAQAGGEKLPSNRALTREHGIGRERAARILRAAADRSLWVRKQRSAVGS